MTSLDPASTLPTELYHEILSYLDASDLAKCSRASASWKRLADDGVLWQSLCHTRWQGKQYMRRVYRTGIPFLYIDISQTIMAVLPREMEMGIWTSRSRGPTK